MKIYWFYIAFFITLLSCKQKDFLLLKIDYNDQKRYSFVVLLNKNIILDSFKILDYYNSCKMNQIDNHIWHVSHIDRCGSDCSAKIQYIFMVKGNKLIKSLELPLSNEDSYLKDTMYISKFDNDSLQIVHKIFFDNYIEPKIVNKQSIYTLKFDGENKTYFNDNLLYKGGDYKTIKIEDWVYVYINNNWGNFKNDTIYTIDQY
jgi:hypothetical protein